MPGSKDTIPIFTASKSLDVCYNFTSEQATTTVYGAHTHAKLIAGYKGLLDKRASLTTKSGKTRYSANLDMINFATAAVTFLYTDTSPEEGYLGEDVEQATFALSINADTRIFNCMDLYVNVTTQPNVCGNKAARDGQFNQHLFQRIKVLKDISFKYDFTPGAITTEKGLNKSIKSATFHDTYHHTEQAIMHSLSSSKGLRSLVATAQSLDAKYLYGTQIDIFTVRMMCKNCNTGMIGMQNSQNEGYLADLTSALKKHHIATDKDYPMVGFCVSAAPGLVKQNTHGVFNIGEKDVVHQFVTDEYPRIYQATNFSLGTKKIIKEHKYDLSSYPGAFFASRDFSNDVLEKEIKLPKSLRLKSLT